MQDLELHCEKSINILRNQCIKYFNSIDLDSNVKFVDAVPNALSLFSNSSHVDIVFFGGIIRRLWEIEQWDFTNARLWCLSTTYKEILTKIFKVPEKSITVIPRGSLFKVASSYIPSIHSKIRLVYGGRISATKNIDVLLELVSILQIEYKLNIELNIFGSYDSELNLSARPQKRDHYQNVIEILISELKWTSPPKFHPETCEDKWVNDCSDDSIFISLSKYLQEDFGVSAAQWGERGRPMIISDWGGHRDIEYEGSFKIPTCYIPDYDSPRHVHKNLVKKLSNYFVHNFFKDKQSTMNIWNKVNLEYISKTEIVACVNAKKISLGCIEDYLNHGKWELFCTKEAGQNFINLLETQFEKSNPISRNVIISNWFDSARRIETSNVPEIVSEMTKDLSHYEFIYFRDIHLIKNVKKIMLAGKIFFPYFIPEMKKMINELTGDLSKTPPLEIILHPSQEDLLKPFKKTLREIDSISIFSTERLA
ncbi:MAG: hypothetical protein KAG61_00260 [Bacteriovoracaceae bacterium]|nr:hypothetical protein [Bacteriovoracaceae bacterium]